MTSLLPIPLFSVLIPHPFWHCSPIPPSQNPSFQRLQIGSLGTLPQTRFVWLSKELGFSFLFDLAANMENSVGFWLSLGKLEDVTIWAQSLTKPTSRFSACWANHVHCCARFISSVSERFFPPGFHALGPLRLGMCGLQLFFHSPVKSRCFQGSLLGSFPFPLCTTYTLKFPLCLKSWQSFICPPKYFKRFWIEKPKVWNPMIPTSLEASPAPPASVTPSSRGTHRA